MKKIAPLASLCLFACTVDVPSVAPELPPETPSKTTQAVTYGKLDGDAHPAVVLLTMWKDGVRQWRCSGTLLDATTVLTAAHCTELPGTIDHVRVFTESDVDGGNNHYPDAGPNAVESVAIFTHPLYDPSSFWLHDVGIVKLAAPGVVLPATHYGQLPAANSLDALQVRRSTEFTAVGYGLQKVNDGSAVNDKQIRALKIRMSATPYLVQMNTGFTGPQSLVLSNNASTGGTCFGDSGGPNFVGNSLVIGGITSFGMNGACGGTGGVFRADREDVLAFIDAHRD